MVPWNLWQLTGEPWQKNWMHDTCSWWNFGNVSALLTMVEEFPNYEYSHFGDLGQIAYQENSVMHIIMSFHFSRGENNVFTFFLCLILFAFPPLRCTVSKSMADHPHLRCTPLRETFLNYKWCNFIAHLTVIQNWYSTTNTVDSPKGLPKVKFPSNKKNTKGGRKHTGNILSDVQKSGIVVSSWRAYVNGWNTNKCGKDVCDRRSRGQHQ